MAIQNRRGGYTNFDPAKMVAGEFAIVQSSDPTTNDGTAVYIAFGVNQVKRLVTEDDLEETASTLTYDSTTKTVTLTLGGA